MATKSKGSDSLNYAFLLHSCGLGGAELSTLELVQGLVEAGNTVDCLIPFGKNQLAEKMQTVGAEVHRHTPLTWWTSDPLLAIRETPIAETLLRRINPDLVVTVTGVIPQGAIAARNLRTPHVWCLHEFLDIDHGMQVPFSLDAFPKIVSDFSDKVICNSKSVQNYFFPNEHEDAVVLHPYPTFFGRTSQLNEVTERVNTIVKLGLIANFTPGKGHLLLLHAVKEINKYNKLVEVKFFGEGGTDELHAEIRSFILDNSLEESVQFEGYIDSKKRIFESIDVIIVPSSNEGFGRVPFEAMRYGKPIIYSNSGALAEYMIPDKHGIAFESKDSNSLEQAILKLITSETKRRVLINNGYAFIEDISKLESYISKFHQICKEVKSSHLEIPLEHHISRLVEEHSNIVTRYDLFLYLKVREFPKRLRIFLIKVKKSINFHRKGNKF